MACRWIIALCLIACMQSREVFSFQLTIDRIERDSKELSLAEDSTKHFLKSAGFPLQSANHSLSTLHGKRHSVNGKRLYTGTAIIATADIVSLVGLSKLWYSDYDQGAFHFHNDWRNWQQQDKLGHTAASWQIASMTSRFANWSGLNRKQSMIYGFAASTIYQSQIEVLDGFSERWGASPGDIAFNLVGAVGGAYEGVADGPLPLTIKYSYHKSDNYDDTTSIWGNAIKDYDGISHWLVVRPDLLSSSMDWWPAWLGVSIGHTADGLTRAVSSSDEAHERIWMLGLDLDFLRTIQIDNPMLKTFVRTISFVRIPAPAIQIGRDIKFRPIYY